MKWFRKDKYEITVEYITGKGVKAKSYTFTRSPVNKNRYNLIRNGSEIIRVTVENKR